MSRIVLAATIALSLTGPVSYLPVHAQGTDQFKIGKRAYEADNFKTAFKILKPLAETGHAQAQLMVGDMYNLGRGTRQDNSLAIYWYQKSAEQGNFEAIQMLGQGMRLLGESSAN